MLKHNLYRSFLMAITVAISFHAVGCGSNTNNNNAAIVCGDGIVAGDEVCDDGTNDGSYGSCTTDCTAKAAHCGDGEVQAEFESCEPSDTLAEGEIPCTDSCQYAKSCLEIKNHFADTESGEYLIVPTANDVLTEEEAKMSLVKVNCDMEIDGGGYTFLKVSLDDNNNENLLDASDAEALCNDFGMQLFIPRTADHLDVAFKIAQSEGTPFIGDGADLGSEEFISLMGIYPVEAGSSCVGSALNSTDCPEWEASDGGEFFVTGADESIEDQPANSNCENCSMFYAFKEGQFVYEAFSNGGIGATSYRFMCSTNDK